MKSSERVPRGVVPFIVSESGVMTGRAGVLWVDIICVVAHTRIM